MKKKLNYVQDWPELARKANWSVKKLAKFCNVSSRTLERYFAKNMGKPPKQWLIEQRHSEAAKMLSDGTSVKKTASEFGYAHPSTFAREFKKVSKRSSAPFVPSAIAPARAIIVA